MSETPEITTCSDCPVPLWGFWELQHGRCVACIKWEREHNPETFDDFNPLVHKVSDLHAVVVGTGLHTHAALPMAERTICGQVYDQVLGSWTGRPKGAAWPKLCRKCKRRTGEGE